MTTHDRIRKERAEYATSGTYSSRKEEMEAIADAIRGLQSTDDPSLCDLCDSLMARYQELEKGEVDE